MKTPEIEVEVKSLLSGAEEAFIVLSKIIEMPHKSIAYGNVEVSKSTPIHEQQLNHYFMSDPAALVRLIQSIENYVTGEVLTQLKFVLSYSNSYSLRTRYSTNLHRPLLVVKADMAVGSYDSENGNSRYEVEAPIGSLSFDELDALIVKSGFKYQSKWSRDRYMVYSTFHGSPITFCIDKNSGYGWLLEVETLADAEDVDAALLQVRQVLSDLGVTELDAQRLKRMFAHYNENWKKYYQKEKFFTVE